MPVAALVSFRLGGTDGVSVEAAKWRVALEQLGYEVATVAGEGAVDHRVRGLAIGAETPPDHDALERALDGAAVVIVENLCSLPLNPAAAEAVAELLANRPALLHHHDLAWQRPHMGDRPPPDRPLWRHVAINERSRHELAERGIEAVTLYNCFDADVAPGERAETRAALGVAAGQPLVLQPTRALPRKNIPAGVALAERLEAAYWLLGPAEDGYGPELARVLGAARCPVHEGAPPGRPRSVADAYAACDLVTLPSTWEGFGNPAVESALHRRPLCIGPYPVAAELAAFGFEWFGLDDVDALERFLADPDTDLLEHNRAVAIAHFSLARLAERLGAVLATLPI